MITKKYLLFFLLESRVGKRDEFTLSKDSQLFLLHSGGKV
jgi:hypothetical protein